MRNFACATACLLLDVTAGMMAGCADRTDARVKNTWSDAVVAAHAQPAKPTGPRGDRSPNPGRRTVETVTGWERIDVFIGRAIRVLARSPGPERFELLASRWCEIDPEPLVTEHGDVRVCSPETPVEVDGHEFTLELGAVGTIGLVSQELTDAQSQAVTARGRTTIEHRCVERFAPVVHFDATAGRRDEFFTCPVEGGSTLAIGRMPMPGTSLWQVSIAVLWPH